MSEARVGHSTRMLKPVQPRSHFILAAVMIMVFALLISGSDASQSFSGQIVSPLAGKVFVENRVIVKFKPSTDAAAAGDFRRSIGSTLIRELDFIGAELLSLDGRSVSNTIEQYRGDPRIDYIEPDYVYHVDVDPNDPRFPEMWGLKNTGQSGGTVDADIDAPEAWNVSTGSTVVIGDIDTGIDTAHADLRDNLWRNPGEIPGNGQDDDNNGFVDDIFGWDFVNDDPVPLDDYGHGSHTSGTIAAVGNNGIGVTGVCWSGRIMGLKFLDSGGYGSTSDAVSAVAYATRMGAKLTNNSWGGGPYSAALEDAIDSSGAHGLLFIASAGNSSENIDVYATYPCGYDLPNIISVAATNRNDQLAWFSNWGPVGVDLAAPGDEILSTIPGGGYMFAGGTSMAAPHVSGVAALIWTLYPTISWEAVKNRIMMMADPLPQLSGYCQTGGRLNAFMAIAQLDSIPPAAIGDLTVSKTEATRVTLSWTATGDDSLSGRASYYDIRYAQVPINESNFYEATRVGSFLEPDPAGSPQSYIVTSLTFSTDYYFALKAVDEWGTTSSISNVATTTTLGPPDASITPPQIVDSLFTAETSTHELQLSNLGEGELIYTTKISTSSSKFERATIVVPPHPAVIGGEAALSAIKSNPKPGFDYDIARDRRFDTHLRVLLLYADYDASFLKSLLDNYSDLDTVATWYCGQLPGIDYLLQFDVVVAWNNYAWPDKVGIGDLLANYIDEGGAVVTAVDCWSAGSYASLGRYFEEPGYSPFHSLGGAMYLTRTLGSYDSSHPLMDGVTALGCYQFYNRVELSNGAELVASFDDSTPLVAANPHTVAINLWWGDWSGDYPTLMHNALFYAALGNNWLSVEPKEGEVAPFSSSSATVTINAKAMYGGDYQASLVYQSNDPDQPELSVPVYLHVTGVPSISVEPETLDFDWAYIGFSDTLTLSLSNEGTDFLAINSISSSSSLFLAGSIEPFVLAPRKDTLISIIFAPTSTDVVFADLEIQSNDPLHSTIVTHLKGYGWVPPSLTVSPPQIRETIPMGVNTSIPLVLANTGGSLLSVSARVIGSQTLRDIALEVVSGIEPEITVNDDGESVTRFNAEQEELLRARLDEYNRKVNGLAVARELPRIGVCGGDAPGLMYYTAQDSIIASKYVLQVVSNYSQFESIQDFDGLLVAEWDYDVVEAEISALEQYAASGKPIIMGMDDIDDEPLGIRNRMLALFGIAGVADGDFYFGTLNSQNPITNGLTYVNSFAGDNDYYLLDDADWVFTGTDNQYYGVSLIRRYRAALFGENLYYVVGSDNLPLLRNCLEWAIGSLGWIRVEPRQAEIGPGQSILMEASFNTVKLPPEVYSATIQLTSNDPANNQRSVDVMISVSDAPDISVAAEGINFGTQYIGATTLDSVEIENLGSSLLTLRQIRVIEGGEVSPNYSTSAAMTAVQPGGKLSIAVTYAPTGIGVHDAILEISSDDPDESLVTLPLTGKTLQPPLMTLSPLSFSDSLLTGQVSTHALTAQNSGAGELTMSIFSRQSRDLLGLARQVTDGLSIASHQRVDGLEEASLEADQKRVLAERIAEYVRRASEMNFGLTVPKLAVCGWDQDYMSYLLLSDSSIAANFLVVPLYSYTQLEQYDGLVISEYDFGIDQSEVLFIRAFAESGKPVIMGMDDLDDEPQAVRDALFPVFGIDGVWDGDFYGGVPNPENPIADGISWVNGFSGDNDRYSLSGANWIIGSGEDNYYGISFEGRAKTVLFGEALAYVMNAGNQRLIVQAIEWMTSGTGWLSVSPTSVSVPPFSSRELEVKFNAYRVAGGDYSKEIIITSNDLNQPEAVIPAALRVTAAADAMVTPPALAFGTVIIGTNKSDSLLIENPGVLPLEVSLTSTNTDFGISAGFVEIAPQGRAVISVLYTPTSSGPVEATLNLSTNDPDKGEIKVGLSGAGIDPPEIYVTPTSFLDSLLTDELIAHEFTIRNHGVADLHWRAELDDAEAGLVIEESPTFTGYVNPDALESPSVPGVSDDSLGYRSKPTLADGGSGTEDDPPLAEVLASLNRNVLNVTRQIPSRYDFSEGETGYAIVDGGNNMYEYGNYLHTWNCSSIPYTNGVIQRSNCLGNSVRDYFTVKYPGLFVLAADVDNIYYLGTRGALGAGGAGSVNGATLLLTAENRNFTGFVKRVYGTGTPSVNHLMIVESAAGLNQWLSYYTGSDEHYVELPPSSQRIYYLLFAGANGAYIDDEAMLRIMRRFLEASGVIHSLLSFEPHDGVIPAGQSQIVQLEVDATDALDGDYTRVVTIECNDPVNPEAFVTSQIHVTGIPQVEIAPIQLVFDTVFTATSRTRMLEISNVGTAMLHVAGISMTNTAYSVDPDVFDLPFDSTIQLSVTLSPVIPGNHNAEMIIHSDNALDSALVVPLQGIAADPPVISVSPTEFLDSLLTGEIAQHQLTVSNNGVADLIWSSGTALSGSALIVESSPTFVSTSRVSKEFDTNAKNDSTATPDYSSIPLAVARREAPQSDDFGLEAVLESLESGYSRINSLIPNRFDFSEGENGYYISDGGNDMYDDGNVLTTTACGSLVYSNKVIRANPCLGGADKRYFTAKYPGLFVFVAEIQDIDAFTIIGNLGADGGGSLDGAVLEATSSGRHFAGFVKRVYNTYDPSVNHLIIVESNPGLSHSFPTNTNDDTHIVTLTPAVHRIYYLLFAGRDGYYINNEAMMAIMSEFLEVAKIVPSTVTLSPSTGLIPSGSFQTVDVTVSAEGLNEGDYTTLLNFESNDPVTPLVAGASQLHVTGTPEIEIETAEIDFDTVFTGTTTAVNLAVTNLGTAVLHVSSLSISNAAYSASPDSLDVSIDSTALLNVTFTPTAAGRYAAELLIRSDDVSDSVLAVSLDGVSIDPPIISIEPASLIDTVMIGDTDVVDLVLSNLGNSTLTWNAHARRPLTSMGLARESTIESGAAATEEGPFNELREIRANLFASASKVASLIPERYDFTEGEIGEAINDGGNDMYDVGNILTLEGVGVIPYSNDSISTYTYQGLERKYFTRKFPGLWVFAADMAGQNSLTISGGLGAQGFGQTNYDAIVAEYGGHTFIGLLKRVYDANEPSVNHLIIVENSSSAAQYGDYWTGSDYHYIYGLSGISRLYYLLFAGANGRFIDNTEAQQIMLEFLKGISGPSTVRLSKGSGVLEPGRSDTLSAIFDAREVIGGLYSSEFVFSSNDPFDSIRTVPADLRAIGVPNLVVSDTEVDFGYVFLGSTGSKTMILSNEGSDILEVRSIATNSPHFQVGQSSMQLPPGSWRLLSLAFTPPDTVTATANLVLLCNDPDNDSVTVALIGRGDYPPEISVAPESYSFDLASGEAAGSTLSIANSGTGQLRYRITTQLTGNEKGTEDLIRPRILEPAFVDATTPGEGYHPIASPEFRADRSRALPHVLLVQDALPWNTAANEVIMEQLGIAYDRLTSSSLASTSLDDYTVIILAGGQPQSFYQNIHTMETMLEEWVADGGTLQFHAAFGGFPGGDPSTVILPELAQVMWYGPLSFNTVFALEHPLASGVSLEIYFPQGVSSGEIVNLPTGKLGIIGEKVYNYERYTLAEYRHERGTVIVSTLFLEYGFAYGSEAGEVLENMIPYALSRSRVPWLSLSDYEGAVAPGGEAALDLSVSTNGLWNGSRQSSIFIESNDADESLIEVPVTLSVSGAPPLVVDTSAIDFGEVSLGNFGTRRLIVSNVGTNPLTVFFEVFDQHFWLNTSTYTIQPSYSEALIINFHPDALAEVQGSLLVTCDDPEAKPLSIRLIGKGRIGSSHFDTCRIAYEGTGNAMPDSGQCDTVRIASPIYVPTIVAGDSILIPIHAWTDTQIGGFALGFHYDNDFVEISSWTPNPEVVPVGGTGIPLFLVNPAENKALIGWISFMMASVGPIPDGAAPILGTLNMRILNGASDADINLDSTYVSPGGRWEFASRSSSSVSPLYVDNGLVDIILGAGEIRPCGDADGNSIVSISDAVFMINYIFSGGPAPSPLSAGDADCNALVTISDAVYLIQYIFAGGPAPCSACP